MKSIQYASSLNCCMIQRFSFDKPSFLWLSRCKISKINAIDAETIYLLLSICAYCVCIFVNNFQNNCLLIENFTINLLTRGVMQYLKILCASFPLWQTNQPKIISVDTLQGSSPTIHHINSMNKKHPKIHANSISVQLTWKPTLHTHRTFNTLL